MQAVILAAGESSRFQPLSYDRHKALTKVCGKSIVEWTIDSLKRAGISDIILVEGPEREIQTPLNEDQLGTRIQYVVQEKPLGMGNALLQAEGLLKDNFFVLNPNHYDADVFIGQMSEKQRATGAKVILVGRKTDTPENYGILSLEGDRARGLVEKPKRSAAPSDVRVVGIYLISREFFAAYRRVKENMYAFEDALRLFMKENDVRVVMTEKDIPTLKYPWDLFGISKDIIDRCVRGQFVDGSAKIADSAVIDGPVNIGANVTIMENVVIKGPCFLGAGTLVGTNALVRSYCNIGESCQIGANTEIARSIIGDGTHMHSGFLGDSIVGDNCRIGAGMITSNVRIDRENIMPVVKGGVVDSGMASLGAIIGHDTKLGIGVRTMPGIIIGSECVVGPATVVLENVESKTTYYTEFKSVVKKR